MIFKSPHASVTIPEISVTDYVLRRARELGDKPALIDGPTGRTYTYGELPGVIGTLAAGFARQGLRKGDVLAIFSPNLPEYALAFHAAATLGVATTMVPPLFTDEEIIKQLSNSGAKYLLTIPQLMEKASGVAQATGINKIFVFGEAEGAISFASLLKNDDKPRSGMVVHPRADAAPGFSTVARTTTERSRSILGAIDSLRRRHAGRQYCGCLPGASRLRD